MNKKIAVIGGGPGGYVAAIRAAQLGAEVHLVERATLGGTCLNVGCIPTKVLIHGAGQYNALKKAGSQGLFCENPRVDWAALMRHKDEIVATNALGVKGLLRSNNVSVYDGQAILKDAHTVIVNGAQKVEITADAVILALGSRPVYIKFSGSELDGVIDSAQALSLPEIPTSMVIVGGGVIGTEFAALYSALGTKVTVVEMLPEILPPVDAQITAILRKELKKQGVSILVESTLTGVEKRNGNLVAKLNTKNGQQELESQYVLVAVGRKPNTENCGLEAVGVLRDRTVVVVDANFRTNIPSIYAIGDCNAQIMLAHAASAQGIAAAEHIMGRQHSYNGNIIPNCVYSTPEIAGVGLTETLAKAKGIDYKVGQFNLAGNGKSMIEAMPNGLIKIIAEAGSGRILGAHMIGPRVTDMIGEIAIAMTLGATVSDIVRTVHAHPTVSEAVAEAAHGVFGHAIHWPA